MLEINVNDLVSGITFNKPLVDEKGSRIASPNSPLTQDEINLLKKWGIQKVRTEGRITSGHMIHESKDSASGSTYNAAAQNTAAKAEKNTDTNVEFTGVSQAQKSKLMNLYDEWIISVSQILKDLSTGIKVDKNLILNVIDRLVMSVPEYKNIFLSIAQMRETEEYIFGHSLNMAIISIIIGNALKYNNANLRMLGIAALLGDIGMLKIPKHIREKNIKLNDADVQLIKTHPIGSSKIIQNYGQFPETIAEVAKQLHENYDGSGYPQGKKGDEIHEYAKIISIADSFDAMSKNRSFRKEIIPHSIMKELIKMSEKKFDPRIMKIFLVTMAIYPIGSMVQLDTNELGLVIQISEQSPLKPMIRILYDSKLKKLPENETHIVDMLKKDTVKIIKVINPKELGISVVNEL